MAADAAPLARRIERARAVRAAAAEWERIASAVARSVARREARASRRPAIDYPPDLPVGARADEIARAIRDHPVVIVCGETGSGKTTQLPKICLAAGRGERGLIGHTQPRRIAARAVATRIAQELGTEPGEVVGYKVRFTDHTKPDAFVKLMTDGILLAETQGDPLLAAYDTIIIDEAHERSLNIDFLLGYLKQLLARRPDLRVIITSATLDADRFARHFGTVERRPRSSRCRAGCIRSRCATGRSRRATPKSTTRRSWKTRSSTRSKTSGARGPGTSWCFSPASARSARPRRC